MAVVEAESARRRGRRGHGNHRGERAIRPPQIRWGSSRSSITSYATSPAYAAGLAAYVPRNGDPIIVPRGPPSCRVMPARRLAALQWTFVRVTVIASIAASASERSVQRLVPARRESTAPSVLGAPRCLSRLSPPTLHQALGLCGRWG